MFIPSDLFGGCKVMFQLWSSAFWSFIPVCSIPKKNFTETLNENEVYIYTDLVGENGRAKQG